MPWRCYCLLLAGLSSLKSTWNLSQPGDDGDDGSGGHGHDGSDGDGDGHRQQGDGDDGDDGGGGHDHGDEGGDGEDNIGIIFKIMMTVSKH